MAYEQKTVPTGAGVEVFIDAISDDGRRAEVKRLVEMMERATGHEPRMWGASMVGFGEYHYRQPSGHKGFWFVTGFAPRKGVLTVYVMPGFEEWPHLMERLGRFTTGKSCLYLKHLSDVDETVLEELIRSSVTLMRERYQVADG